MARIDWQRAEEGLSPLAPPFPGAKQPARRAPNAPADHLVGSRRSHVSGTGGGGRSSPHAVPPSTAATVRA